MMCGCVCVCVCILLAIASHLLILGWMDTFGMMTWTQALVNVGAEQNEDTKWRQKVMNKDVVINYNWKLWIKFYGPQCFLVFIIDLIEIMNFLQPHLFTMVLCAKILKLI